MADKPELNKSQAIRDYFTANPKATTQEVIDALAKQGITVTSGVVRTTKFMHNKRQAAKKAAKKPATSPVEAPRPRRRSPKSTSPKPSVTT